MAQRIWINGTGNTSDINHWSTTSGGTGGASIPGSSDEAIFDANSFTAGSKTVTQDGLSTIKSMDWTGSVSGATLNMSASLTVNGSVTFATGMVVGGAGSLTISPSSGTANLTMNGMTWAATGNVITGGNGNVTLVDDLTLSSGSAQFLPGNSGSGTFSTGNRAITCTFFRAGNGGSTLNLTNSTITITGTTSQWTIAGTLIAGTSSITFTGNGGTFSGSSKTYYDIFFQNNITIGGCNTYHAVTVAAGKTITYSNACIQTIQTLNAIGTSANHIVFQSSSSGNAGTFAISGAANVAYANVIDNTATGAATPIYNPNGVNNGNTSGWNFSAAPSTDSSKWRGAILMNLFN